MHTDETHHLYMRRYRGRACELCIGVHTAHGISHSVRSRTCCHVVRVKGTSCTAAGCYGKVFLACSTHSFL